MKRILSILFFAITIIIVVKCKKNDVPLINYTIFTTNSYNTDFMGPFRCMYFYDENVGYISTDSGKIYKTVNQGVNWTLQKSQTNLPLYAICFVNENTGYAVGGQSSCGGTGCEVPGSVIEKTIDGGKTWIKQNIPYCWSELHSVCFTSLNKGFAVGLGLLLKTTDGGTTWNEFSIDYQGYISKVYFVNVKLGFIIGLHGNLFKTIDGGENWTKINTTKTELNLYDITFVNDKIGFCGGDPHLLKTMDSGNTWFMLDSSATSYSQIYFIDENYGFTIGSGHYTGGDFGYTTTMLAETKDGGKTWIKHDNLEFGYPICFPLKNIGYTFGKVGKIYKIEIEINK